VNETKMERHRIEMAASLLFDVVMPETATEEEIKARAALDYQNAVDDWGGFTVNGSLPYCRVYIATADSLEPADLNIADTMSFEMDEETTKKRNKSSQ
jgi:hypothetical protein